MSNGTPPPPPPASTPPPPQGPPSQGPSPQSSPQGPSAGGVPYNPAGTGGETGMPTWAKVGIGCGCLLAIAGAILAFMLFYAGKKAVDMAKDFEANPAKAVETLIKLNPELDVVSNDPDSGKITIRNKQTGEESTFDYSEIKEGRINFEGDQGSFSMDTQEDGTVTVKTDEGEARFGAGAKNVPGWVPRYPGAETDEQGGMTSVQGGKASGLFLSRSTDDFESVVAWYEKKLEDESYAVERSSVAFGGNEQVILNGTKEGVDQLMVAVGREEGKPGTQITITYSGPES